MSGPVGLWTDGTVTLRLACVKAAMWMWTNESTRNDGQSRYIANLVEMRTTMDHSTDFVVLVDGGDKFTWSSQSAQYNHRAIGVSFLQALSLYWETRA